jgi:glyoxylase-like metal-dependent hydrolase (beta-lactamase superfamily II)
MELTHNSSSYFTLEKLSDGIYAAIAKHGEGAMSNSGFIDLGEGVLIFDTFTTPNAAKELRIVAEDLTQKNINYVFNSHFHGDHTFGNQVFEEAVILSTSVTRELHKTRNAVADPVKEVEEMTVYLNQLNERRQAETDPINRVSLENQWKEISKVTAAVPELRMVLPHLTFEDNLVIHGSKRSVELYCFGGGHTESDAFLYLPEEKIAFMGDLVLENHHPPIYNSQAFITNLTKVKELDITKIVTGHGNVVGRMQIDVMLTYLTHINDCVKTALERGETLDELLATETPKAYSTWLGVDGYKRSLTSVFYEKNK